ncbi:MAG: Do family serine endopeptidase [Nitrospirae bacterium]|nr:Do family serine endopeptidase [Nitrospirota bacterium]
MLNAKALRGRSILALFVVLVFLSLSVSAPSSATPLKDNAGTKVLQDLQNVFVDLADRVKPAVVNISPATHPTAKPGESPHGSRPPEGSGSGSGVIIDKKGYIVTNNHVVGEAAEVEVRLSDKSHFTGKVVGKDPDTDVAVVKIEAGRELPYVTLGDSSTVKVGQWVIAVGNPFGLDRTVTVGVVSALGRENVNLSRYEDFIQTDASINPGNSGGPLFNIYGDVIGINTAIINFAQGIGFAIPSNMVQNVMNQLISKGRVVRGWLGVGIQPVTADLATKFNVKEEEGVLVNEVFEGDPASKGGMQPGDIIVKLDGKVVDTPQTLSRLIAQLQPGKDAAFEIIRDGKQKNLTVKLGERKEEAITASIPKQPDMVLGLNVQDLTPELADRFKLKDEKGVLVTKVEPGSAADSEGIKEGDLIKEINRSKVTNSEEFKGAIERVKKGESVLIRIIRESRAFYVVLKTQPE